jgi:hypothetical protein
VRPFRHVAIGLVLLVVLICTGCEILTKFFYGGSHPKEPEPGTVVGNQPSMSVRQAKDYAEYEHWQDVRDKRVPH